MDLNKRLFAHCHITTYRVGKVIERRHRLIKHLRRKNLRPDIVCLKVCEISKADLYEKKVYVFFKKLGFDLIQDGSKFCYNRQHTESAVKKRTLRKKFK